MPSHCSLTKQTNKNAISSHRKTSPLAIFPSTSSLIVLRAPPINYMNVEKEFLETDYLSLHLAFSLSSLGELINLSVSHLKINDKVESTSQSVWGCFLFVGKLTRVHSSGHLLCSLSVVFIPTSWLSHLLLISWF